MNRVCVRLNVAIHESPFKLPQMRERMVFMWTKGFPTREDAVSYLGVSSFSVQ